MRLSLNGFAGATGLFVLGAVMVAATAQALPSERAIGKRSLPAEATPESPANGEFRKGIDAALQGKNETARSHYLAALTLDAKFAPAMIGLADLAQKKGERSLAEKYLQQAQEAAPQAASVQVAWGRFHLAAGSFAAAESSFKKARDLNPKSITPLLELGDLYLRDAARRGDAVQSFASAMKLEPGNKYATYSFGVASAALGHRDDALGAFEKTAALAPKDPAPWRAAGRLYLEAGSMDKALNAFDQGLKRQPNSIPLMLDRSDALARQGKWAEAIGQLEVAARSAPSSSEIRVKLGDVYQGAKRWDDARSAYVKAVELDGKNALAHNNLAWMLVQQGLSPEKAVASAHQAVSLSPKSAPFLDTLGWAQRATGDLPAAAESLRRATDIEPKSAEFQFHYGVVLLDLKRTADARQALSRALDPRFSQSDEARRLLRTLQAN